MCQKITSRPKIISQLLKELRVQNGLSLYGAINYLGLEKDKVQSIESNSDEAEFALVLRYARLMEVPFQTILCWMEVVEEKLYSLGCEVVDACDEDDDFFSDEYEYEDEDVERRPKGDQSDRPVVKMLISEIVAEHLRYQRRPYPRRPNPLRGRYRRSND